MKKTRKIFKDPLSQKDQYMLLPLSVNDFITEDSEARIIDEIINSMDHSELIGKYTGGGASAYNPIMLLKILIYAGCNGIRSSRVIEKLLHKDLEYMYLSEMSKPNFRTISDFRKDNLEALENVFRETVKMSMKMGIVLLKHVSVDGTRLEANVSKDNSFNKERLEKALERAENRISEIMAEWDEADKEEDKLYGDSNGRDIKESLKKAEARKKKLEEIKAEMEKEGINTIGWTDKDSRLMKTKGGVRAGYNLQAVVDSESQIIIANEVSQESADNGLLPDMLEEAKKNTGEKPEIVTADGGYYSPESLKYADKENVDLYIPNKRGQEEQKNKFKYDESKDVYICPAGNELTYYKTRKRGDYTCRLYRLKCGSCPLSTTCEHANKSRKVEKWVRLDGQLQDAMAKKVSSPEGKKIYKQRMSIIEPVFGNIKHNKGFNKLRLRGLDGVDIEWNLGCIWHNIGKILRYWAERKVLLGI